MSVLCDVRFACVTAGIAASLISLVTVANASTATVADTYWGGRNVYTSGPNSDVVANSGDNRFNISGATLTRAGNNLEITINTNYANTVHGLQGAEGTSLGALFLGVNAPIYNNGYTALTSPDPTGHYAQDSYFKNDNSGTALDPGRFKYAFSPTLNNAGAGAHVANGYALNGNGSDVQAAYGDNTRDTDRNDIRSFQQVGVNRNATLLNLPGVSATWTLGDQTITFDVLNIFGPGKLTDTFWFSWAMTCANDVIYAQVTLPCDNCAPPPVPIPAALPLFVSGLGLLGLFGQRRRRQARATSVTAQS